MRTLSGCAWMGFLLTRVVPALLAAWVVAVVAVYALYHGGKPVHAGAVVVLQGSSTRLPIGLRLVREGYAPLLVISRGSHKKLEARLCSGRLRVPRVNVLCFEADPPSTRGEAEFVGRLARDHHFTRIDVVTSRFHVFRARIVIARCYHGRLRMVGAPQVNWKLPWDAVTETAKLVYQEVFARRC
jgi:uncharacterized SAM-binding protein YcdF (DUF218 family)